MTHNQRAGVIAGSAHLALQSVSKEQAGKYSCTASNVEGDGKSRAVNLQVICKLFDNNYKGFSITMNMCFVSEI